MSTFNYVIHSNNVSSIFSNIFTAINLYLSISKKTMYLYNHNNGTRKDIDLQNIYYSKMKMRLISFKFEEFYSSISRTSMTADPVTSTSSFEVKVAMIFCDPAF